MKPILRIVTLCLTFLTNMYAISYDVPVIGQRWSPWSSDTLGTCSVNTTIGSDGCAITATAMLLNYYGDNTDPRELNTWLKNNGGYSSGCLINWSVAATKMSNVQWVESLSYASIPADLDRIKNELDSGYPVVAEVRLSGNKHFVVLTGYVGSTFYINDPWYGNQSTLSDNGYGSDPAVAIYGIRVFHGSIERPDIRLYSQVSFDPNPIEQGSPVSIQVKIANYGSADFQGDFAAALHTSSGSFVGDIEIKTNQTLSSNKYKTYTFSKDTIVSNPGNYQIQIKYNSSSWNVIPEGAYDNPVPVQIVAASSQVDEATFTGNETIPDGTSFDGGSSFTKQWTIRNTGTTTWNSNYCLKHYSGTSMGVTSSVCVSGSVAHNASYTFSVPMHAPVAQSTQKTYTDYWKLYKSGSAITLKPSSSNYVFVQIKVNASGGVSGSIDGIDVSRVQGVVNWPMVKTNGIVFSYVKATEGYLEGYSEQELINQKALDAYYRENMQGALSAGVLVAPYHFARPDLNHGIEEAKKEAAFFVSFIRSYYEVNRLLPPAIDIEDGSDKDNASCQGGLLGCYSKTTLTDWLLAFAQEVERLLGVKPIFYMNESFTGSHVDLRLSQSYDLWVAKYSSLRPSQSHWDNWLFLAIHLFRKCRGCLCQCR